MTSRVTPDGRPPVPQGRQPWSRFSARGPVGCPAAGPAPVMRGFSVRFVLLSRPFAVG